jgi:hypothetical protein
MSDANTPPPTSTSSPTRPDVEMVFDALFGSANLVPKKKENS